MTVANTEIIAQSAEGTMRLACLTAALAVVGPLHVALAQTSRTERAEPRVAVIAATGFARENDVGYHALVGLEARTPIPLLRMRVEGLFADMGGDANPGGRPKIAALALTSTASLFKRTTTPYLLSSFAVARNHGAQRAWSVGAGWRFSLVQRSAFVESRIYSVHDPRTGPPFGQGWRSFYTPVSIGLRF